MTDDGLREREGEAAGLAAAPEVELDGVFLPGEVLSDDPSLGPATFRSAPVEVSYFVAHPADEVARVCEGLADGTAPRRTEVVDRYFDTPDQALFRQGVSVRLREYLRHTRPVVFEGVAVSWRNVAPGGPLGARANQLLVHTFARNDGADFVRMRERYARAGLVEVARVSKTRTGFDLLPVLAERAGGGAVPAPDVRPVGDLGALRITDLGLKVVVDELHDAPFAEATIVEVEYDARHEARAVALVARLRAALGPALRPKERNKIAYLLAD